MDKVLASGPIGTEGKFDVEFKEGNLLASVSYDGLLGGASVQVKVPAKAVLEAIKNKIPGKIDDAVIGLIESVLLV